MPSFTRLFTLVLSTGFVLIAETASAPSVPKPFQISVPELEIQRTKALLQVQRLQATPIVPGADFSYGTELAWMKKAKDALVNFNWRAAEKSLNSFKQYTVTIEGTTIHYVYEKSSAKNAIPLLLLHGWGSTVSEFNKVIKPLVNPPQGQQAFHIIAPSLPGIGYSSVVQKVNATVVDNARIFNTLMTSILGYKTYVAQGGNFGAINLRQIQTKHADTMKLALFEGFPAPRPANATNDSQLPDYERHLLELVAYFQAVGTGYLIEQTTKVSTIGLTMYDRPQGFLSYLGMLNLHGRKYNTDKPTGEKYVMIQNWSNFTAEVNATFLNGMHDIYASDLCTLTTLTDLLTVILYQQYTNTIHTGMSMYQLNGNKYIFDAFAENPSGQAPFGVHHFEGEFYLSPKSWIAQQGPLIWHKCTYYGPRILGSRN
ncbi:Alpha/Beta hydrolase protein [Rhizoctonia solani]|nr:Alpha/Beta hydrolase protein [Rhizoctonia solani]